MRMDQPRVQVQQMFHKMLALQKLLARKQLHSKWTQRAQQKLFFQKWKSASFRRGRSSSAKKSMNNQVIRSSVQSSGRVNPLTNLSVNLRDSRDSKLSYIENGLEIGQVDISYE